MDPRVPKCTKELESTLALKGYCAGVERELQELGSRFARLGELCTKASTAHRQLSDGVPDGAGGVRRPSGQQEAARMPAHIVDAVEAAINSMRALEAEMRANGAAMEGSVAHWGDRSAGARAAAQALMALSTAQLNRRHNEARPHLLDLPDNTLHIIAHKMGKRARALCSKLDAVYGPPGATLVLPTAEVTFAQPGLPPREVFYLSVIRTWPWQPAVRRLVLGDDIAVDGPACAVLSKFLPCLLELECCSIDPLLHTSSGPPAPHPTLSSLAAAQAPSNPAAIAAFAPRLGRLHVRRYKSISAAPSGAAVWGALSSLPRLASLDVPLLLEHLNPATPFASAMQRLTALTHLGLSLTDWDGIDAVPRDATQGFGHALEALPLLASVKLLGFSLLGPALGPALQALGLRSLHLGEQGPHAGPHAHVMHLPDISAMPALERLVLSGERVVGARELRGMLGGAGSASAGGLELRALELIGMCADQLPAACHILARLPALTSLRLLSDRCPAGGVAQRAEHRAALASSLLPLTRLRRLEVRADARGPFVRALAGLSALTCLALAFDRTGLLGPDLEVVRGLRALRKLSLGDFHDGGVRGLCMEAVRKLPLLEDLELGWGRWTEEDVRRLLPPPERLRRVVLVASWTGPGAVQQGHEVVSRLHAYGVDAVVESLR